MSTAFQVESGIPVRAYLYQDKKYPFASMKVGDSFFTAEDRKTRTAASTYQKRHKGYKFTTRKVDGGIRVWRIR